MENHYLQEELYDLEISNVSVPADVQKQLLINRKIQPPLYYIFIILYSILILFGAFGNGLVMFTVLTKKTMRTTRNMFIFNLAVSDLLLCVIAMPFTLIGVLTYYWPLGKTPFLCNISFCVPTICVYVSALSIAAIAIDRYYLIIHPTQNTIESKKAGIALCAIWTIGILFAVPLFISSILTKTVVILHEPLYVPYIIIRSCEEQFSSIFSIAYSVTTVIFQYAVPIITVSVAYRKISKQLKNRMETLMAMLHDKNRIEAEHNRLKRTNQLLASVTVAFAISWLPLHVFLCVDDSFRSFLGNSEKRYILYGICHLVSMTSACLNPVLYGWLNENFRKEFFDMFSCLIKITKSNKNKTPVIIYTKATSTPTPSDSQGVKNKMYERTMTSSSNLHCSSPSLLECDFMSKN
ncbi:neuropeptide F receptor-like [Artemia franciscana]|uniref:G-protein coupled receptors family 1 profile domain-containing protein n=1 Tax=Artemia franciscana TaxID=6661 RepID=A0AA88HHE0_ARTSF|nr:hypothetical protein QYM36_010919 [Artemia franciscana]